MVQLLDFFKIKEVCSSESVIGFDNEFIVRVATSAICFAAFKKSEVSLTHPHFVLLTKCVKGLASIPQEEIPCFLHSTLVVPVPQKGSKTKDA